MLADQVELRTETRISVVWPDKNGVLLRDESADVLGHFDNVVVAAPAPQAAVLLDAVQRYRSRAEAVVMQPAWVVSVVLERRPEALAHIDLLEGVHPELQRVVRDSSKPGRSGEIWTLQASRDWTEAYLNLSADTVMHELVAALVALTGDPLVVKAHRAHRWLYCDAISTESAMALWDADTAMGACGDWLAGGGVEAAWQSGTELARMILSSKS
ncbi:FAD-dependent oxidoreductase [Nitrincola sp. A-D6]|uniref:FAD-dependent oxidoreductase n=1 Tax=Nitrincola sp. A-D6 TaxID=1545442 RepID=UPI00068EDA74|nr:FAD-dependent oxidoreductase [Nitrincola sp. A-D6]